jgi:hypothetical protein
MPASRQGHELTNGSARGGGVGRSGARPEGETPRAAVASPPPSAGVSELRRLKRDVRARWHDVDAASHGGRAAAAALGQRIAFLSRAMHAAGPSDSVIEALRDHLGRLHERERLVRAASDARRAALAGALSPAAPLLPEGAPAAGQQRHRSKTSFRDVVSAATGTRVSSSMSPSRHDSDPSGGLASPVGFTVASAIHDARLGRAY